MINPGEYLTPDECMSSWLGSEALFDVNGMPHLSKIIRKPKGVGCEIKSLADGLAKIMLRLEIQEGKERMATKRFVVRTAANCTPTSPNIGQYTADLAAGNVYKATTAQTMRLLEPWFGTGRTAVGDSYFASVETLLALAKHGVFFMGIVKTAHKEYPMKHLKQWYNDGMAATPPLSRGSHKVLRSSYLGADGTNHYMMACGWAERKTIKTIISNRGTTLEGSKSKRIRHRVIADENNVLTTERYILEVKRPMVVEQLFSVFSAVDIADHYRQGSLSLETSWKTKCWYIRVFATVLGIIFTDCYLAYVLEYKEHHFGLTTECKDFHTFLDELAYQLIHNVLLADTVATRNANNGDEMIPVCLSVCHKKCN